MDSKQFGLSLWASHFFSSRKHVVVVPGSMKIQKKLNSYRGGGCWWFDDDSIKIVPGQDDDPNYGKRNSWGNIKFKFEYVFNNVYCHHSLVHSKYLKSWLWGGGGFFARKIKDIDQDLQKFDVSVTEIPKMVSMNIESLTPRVPTETQGNHVTTQGKAPVTSALYLKRTSHNWSSL